MPCDLTRALAGTNPAYDSANDPRITPDAMNCLSDNIVFFYSNKPEQLTRSDIDNGVLWRNVRQSTGQASVYRVFLWHQNRLTNPPEDIRVGLTLQNNGTSTVSISNGGVMRQTSTSTLNMGRCIAQAQLGNTLDSFSPNQSSVAPGQVGLIADWNPVGENQIIGAYVEFSVTAPSGTQWTLRSAFARMTEALTSKTSPNPVPRGTTGDGRGTWLRNRVAVSNRNNPYAMTVGSRALLVLGQGGQAGPDGCWLATQSLDGDAEDNDGRYGCLYDNIAVSYFSDPTHYGTLDVYLATMGTGFPYFGAVQRPNDTQVYVTPRMEYGGANAAVLIQSVAVPQPVGPGTGTVSFRLATAGGATTPFAVLCRTR